ncbi:MAG TPA: glycosyltransferase, partial [bacterium]|nr:glycosyltransferase [bacterium]
MTNPIRILHVRVDGVFGGVERLILDYFRLLNRQKFISILAPMVNRALLAQGAAALGIAVEFVPMRSRFDSSASRRLEEIIRERKIDLVMAYGIRADLTVSQATQRTGTPWISNVQNLIYNDYSNPVQGRIFYYLDRWILRKADAVTLCARYIKPPLSKGLFKLHNLVHVPNGISFSDPDPKSDSDRLRESIGLSENAQVILCAGRLEHVKGQRLL